MKIKRIFILIVVVSSVNTILQAQDSLKIKFRSRGLLDAAVSGYGKDDTQGYYRLEDFRMGLKATYKNYELKTDIGFGGGKVAIKDLLINVHFNSGILSVGNGYEPFSMDMLTSTSDMRFNQSAAAVLAFTNSRRLGITYHHNNKNWYLATGFYTDNDINSLGDNQSNSFISTSRIVWRKHNNKAKTLLHIGGSVSFKTKEVNADAPPTKTISSEGVTSMFPYPMLETDITNMGTEIKGVAEMLYMSEKIMIQGEYFINRFNRTGGNRAYSPHGGYIQCGLLLKGKGFDYDEIYGIPGRPSSDKAVELVARFNYTDMNDMASDILGGEEKDVSVGLNLYLNKYIGIKINGSYVWVGNHCNNFYQGNFFLAQTRVQYIF